MPRPSPAFLYNRKVSAHLSLIGANLRNAYLWAADLSDANLSGADLSYANLSETSLRGADLTLVIWDHTVCPDGSSSNIFDGDGNTCLNNIP